MTQMTSTAEFPVERTAAFEFLTDPTNWPLFYSGLTGLVGDEPQSLARKGDEVRFRYSVLGRSLEATAVAEEVVPGERLRHTVSVAGLPDVHQEWVYTDEPGGFALQVTMNTGPTDSFFGRAIDRFLVPRVLQRDLEKTLENMEQMFSVGIPG